MGKITAFRGGFSLSKSGHCQICAAPVTLKTAEGAHSDYVTGSDNMDYASKGVGAAGLTTGIIGTALGAVNSGLFGGILGGNPAMMGCSDNQPITRHEMGLENQIAAKDSKIALLESTIYTDGKFDKLKEDINAKFAAVEQQLCEQRVWNTAQTGAIGCMQSQVNALLGLTKMVIPNTNVCPGWGDVTVSVTPAATAAAT